MRIAVLIITAALLSPLSALADEEYIPPVTDALVKKECGECHLTFHPALLPKASWRKMMANLANHFGEDASLDAPIRDKVADFLIANTNDRGADPNNPPLRFTTAGWFSEEHQEERDARRMMKRRKAKSWADCAACHSRAASGHFDE